MQFLFTTAIFLGSLIGQSVWATAVVPNKEIVQNFYEMAFVHHRTAEAANEFIGPEYIQHNPLVADGKEAFIAFFETYYEKYPGAQTFIVRIIAEGDLVVVHAFSRLNQNDRGVAIMDIFKLENHKIVEHWDVIQPVPESSKNPHGMF